MGCYINDHFSELQARHYLRKAGGQGYWFDFTANRVKELRQRYGDNFCLILYASLARDDCFVLPYAIVKKVFLDRLLDDRARWVGYVSPYHEISVGHSPNFERMSIREYYNNFVPLRTV